MRDPSILLLAVALGSACSLNAGRVGPAGPYELPPESPPFPANAVPSGVSPAAFDTTQGDAPPRLLRQARPEYPRWAFDRKISGVVMLEIAIDITGEVTAWKIIKSIPELDAAAVNCVRQWRFSPALVRGEPVVTIARAPVSFRIY